MRSGDGSVESWIMSRVGRRTPLTAFRTLRIEEYGRRITVTAPFPPIGALADAEREPWFQACFRHGARHGTGSRPALRYCHCLLLFGTFCALRPGAIDRAYCPDLEPGSCCIVEAKLSGESVGLPMLAGASLCDERISFIARKPRCPRVRRSPDVILAKLREVIHHQAQIIAARIVVGQLVAPSIGEKAFQFALAQPLQTAPACDSVFDIAARSRDDRPAVSASRRYNFSEPALALRRTRAYSRCHAWRLVSLVCWTCLAARSVASGS